MKRKRAMALLRWVVFLAVVGALVFGGIQVFYLIARPQVTVTHVVEGPVVQAFYATGTLLPEREYPIRANSPGYITKVFVDKGDRVKADQPLAVVSEDSTQQRFDQAKAEREQKAKLADEKSSPVLEELDAKAKALSETLELTRRTQRRLQEAVEKKAGAEMELDRATERVKQNWMELESIKALRKTKKIELDKDLEVAEAGLKMAQWNLDRQTIRCPQGLEEASVLDRPATVGTRVAVNDHIMQIADVRPEKLIMRSQVDEEDVTTVHVGQEVKMTLYAFPSRPFTGKVKTIYKKADTDRRTFEVDVEMTEKDPQFQAGMTGELAFVVEEKASAQVIPRQAVQSGEVWVVKDGTVKRADVKLGLISLERAEVLSGLTTNDEVVISPLPDGVEGKRIRIKEMDPKAAADLNKPKQEKAFTKFN